MPRKLLELPMQVAKAFVKDMRAFHPEQTLSRKMKSQRAKSTPSELPAAGRKKIKLSDAREMFLEMKDHA